MTVTIVYKIITNRKEKTEVSWSVERQCYYNRNGFYSAAVNNVRCELYYYVLTVLW